MAVQSTFVTGNTLTAAQLNGLNQNAYNWTVSTKTASYVLVAADVGTRIVMNSASATTVTVNTGLFSAGDTLFIQNTGAGGTCTVTSGTCTVTASSPLALSPWSGGTLYFTSASSAVFFSTGGGEAWTSYTPTVTQGVAITKTINYAKYALINKVLAVHVMMTCTSAGTGSSIVTVSTPIAATNTDSPYFGCNGVATFYDASAAKPYVMGLHSSSTSFAFVDITAGGNYFGAIPAVTIANGDVISFMAVYEVA
jgi:hypothetical protein